MANVSQPHVLLRGVSKIFPSASGSDGVHALGPVDLDLRSGEFFAVVGPSGCGKSTLLELIAGLATPTAEFEGRRIAGDIPDGIGVVFQEDACFPWLSVEAMSRSACAAAPAERAPRVRRDRPDGAGDFASYPAQLSAACAARLHARTLVLEPRLILLDEPFGALDQQTRLLMGDEVLRLWRQTGATVFLITHALDEAAMLADRIAVMSARPGRLIDIVETNWPRERDSRIVARPEFGGVTARLWKSLREESLKTIGRLVT